MLFDNAIFYLHGSYQYYASPQEKDFTRLCSIVVSNSIIKIKKKKQFAMWSHKDEEYLSNHAAEKRLSGGLLGIWGLR